MNRAGIPTPLDLGPDPEPLSAERFDALLRGSAPSRHARPRRRFEPRPPAVMPPRLPTRV